MSNMAGKAASAAGSSRDTILNIMPQVPLGLGKYFSNQRFNDYTATGTALISAGLSRRSEFAKMDSRAHATRFSFSRRQKSRSGRAFFGNGRVVIEKC